MRLNLNNGNLVMPQQTVGSGGYATNLALTYNSTASASSEFGQSWSGQYNQKITPISSTSVELTKQDGTKLVYQNKDSFGRYEAAPGATGALVQNSDGTWTETQPDGFQVRYDSSGTFAYLQSLAGGRWTISRDGGGRVTKIVDPMAGRMTFAYDEANKLRRVTDSANRITSFVVNGAGLLTSRTNPDQTTMSFRYDASQRLVAHIDPEGNRYSFSYDGTGRVTSATTPSGARTTYAYLSGTNSQVKVTNPANGVATLVFSPENNLRQLIDPQGNRTTYAYANNMTTMIQNASGARTS